MKTRDVNLVVALEKVKQNIIKGSKNFYKPLEKEDSDLVRQFYREHLTLLEIGSVDKKIINSCGTIIAVGYTRVVIGDYGAYVEFDKSQVQVNNIQSKWPGKPNRPVKYIWLETKDKLKTKVYYQQGTVGYADYKIGMFYVDLNDIITVNDRLDFIN